MDAEGTTMAVCDFCGVEVVTGKHAAPLPDGWVSFISTDTKGKTTQQVMCAEQVNLIRAVLGRIPVPHTPDTVAMTIPPQEETQ